MALINKIRFSVLMIVLLCVTFAHPAPIYGQATPNSTPVTIRGFHLVSPTEGWVWTDRLYWTKDAGKTWMDITPPNFNSAYDSPGIAFADNQHGTAVIAALDSNPTGTGVNYSILQTTDGGRIWSMKPLSVFPTDALDFFYPSKISLQFLDVHIGWLTIRAESSSNFDNGILFKTTDGGATWNELNLPVDRFNAPIGDPVYFVTEQLGWIVGESQVDGHLYRTQEGGQTWQSQTVGGLTQGTYEHAFEMPQFVNAQDGLLTIMNLKNTGTEIYITHNSGATWQLDTILSGGETVRLLDSTHWIGISSTQGVVGRTITQAATPTTLNADPALLNIRDMDFVSASAGLALSDYQTCPPNAKPGQCVEQRQLMYTSDGGQTWQVLTLPETNSAH